MAVFGSVAAISITRRSYLVILPDNGGQYLEGNPAEVGNVARPAYRYANGDDLYILNLEHEYTISMRALTNMAPLATTWLMVMWWWLEGFAEFMHYKQGYDAAVSLINSGKMSLSDVLATTYPMILTGECLSGATSSGYAL